MSLSETHNSKLPKVMRNQCATSVAKFSSSNCVRWSLKRYYDRVTLICFFCVWCWVFCVFIFDSCVRLCFSVRHRWTFDVATVHTTKLSRSLTRICWWELRRNGYNMIKCWWGLEVAHKHSRRCQKSNCCFHRRAPWFRASCGREHAYLFKWPSQRKTIVTCIMIRFFALLMGHCGHCGHCGRFDVTHDLISPMWWIFSMLFRSMRLRRHVISGNDFLRETRTLVRPKNDEDADHSEMAWHRETAEILNTDGHLSSMSNATSSIIMMLMEKCDFWNSSCKFFSLLPDCNVFGFVFLSSFSLTMHGTISTKSAEFSRNYQLSEFHQREGFECFATTRLSSSSTQLMDTVTVIVDVTSCPGAAWRNTRGIRSYQVDIVLGPDTPEFSISIHMMWLRQTSPLLQVF